MATSIINWQDMGFVTRFLSNIQDEMRVCCYMRCEEEPFAVFDNGFGSLMVMCRDHAIYNIQQDVTGSRIQNRWRRIR